MAGIQHHLLNVYSPGTVTVTLDADTAVGDLVVVAQTVDWGPVANLVAPATSQPITWTRRATTQTGVQDLPMAVVDTGTITVAGAQTISRQNLQNDVTTWLHVWVIPGGTLISAAAGGGTATASTSHVAPSLPSAQVGDLLLSTAIQEYTGTAPYGVPAGIGDVKQLKSVAYDSYAASGRQTITTAGATGTRTWTHSPARQWASASVLVRPAPAGVNRDLAGSVNAASGANASASRGRALAGAAAGAAGATGAASLTRTLTGAAAAASGATGALIRGTPRALDGAAPAATGAVGALARTRAVSGAAAAAGDGIGALSASRPLAGAAGTGSTAQGVLLVAGSGAFAGTGSAAVGAQGAAIVDRSLAAAAPAGSGAAAALTVVRPLGGAGGAATESTPAPLPVSRPLSAAATATAGAVGTLPVARPLAGAAAAAAAVEADLRVNSGGIFNGAAATVSDAAGALVVDRPLAGAAAAAGSATASLSIDDLAADALAGSATTVTAAVGGLAILRPLGGDGSTAASAIATLSIPAGVPPPQDDLPPRARGWRPAPPRTTPYRPPTVIYTAV